MISARNLTKRYGNTTVLDDVSVDVPRGGVTALIGPNGAGKSTLLSLVANLLTPDGGTVLIDGEPAAKMKHAEFAKRVAVLKQDNHLGMRLTVEELVTFGRYPHSRGRPTVEDHAHVERALDFFELQPLRHRFLDELSGGQRQRAFVAMVLCQDTDYVLLDEPLASLDMRHAVSIMKRLRSVATELDKTVVIVLHDINFAAAYADTIIAMKDGRLLQHAGVEAVMTSEALGAIYDLPVHVETIRGKPVGVYYG